MASVTLEGVQEVVQRQKEQGRQYLRTLLKWTEFDEFGDLRQSVFLDVIYESIVFSASKGFPWSSVAQVGKLAEELFHEVKGASVVDVIHIIRNKLQQSENGWTSNIQMILLDYFINLFIRHYHLYQFVLSQDQEIHLTCIKLEVEPPPQPFALNEGIHIDAWNYQLQVAALSSAEAQERSNMLLLREKLQMEAKEILQELFDDLGIELTQSLDSEILEKVVKDVIARLVQIAKEILQEEITINFEILGLQLEKKTLKPPPEYPPPLPSETLPKEETVNKPRKSKSSRKKSFGKQ